MLNAPIDSERTPAPLPGRDIDALSQPLPEPSPDAPESGLPRAAMVYVMAVFLAGLGSMLWFAPRLDTDDLPGFLVLAVLAVAFGRTKIQIYGDTTVSIAVVGDFAVAFLFGPAGAAIVSPFAALATDFGSGGAWYKRLFNIGSVVVGNVVVAVLIRALLDLQGPGLPINGWLIPIAGAAIMAAYLLNIGMVTLAVSLSTRTSIFSVFREKFEWLLPHYVIFGYLGLALAMAYDGLGWGSPASSRSWHRR
jgi:hypothetical protein